MVEVEIEMETEKKKSTDCHTLSSLCGWNNGDSPCHQFWSSNEAQNSKCLFQISRFVWPRKKFFYPVKVGHAQSIQRKVSSSLTWRRLQYQECSGLFSWNSQTMVLRSFPQNRTVQWCCSNSCFCNKSLMYFLCFILIEFSSLFISNSIQVFDFSQIPHLERFWQLHF